jgi:ATP-dependent Clp protease ATP-binding subunit ClpB
MEVGPDALELLVRAGYHRMLGARPMRGVVERYLQEMVANDLLPVAENLARWGSTPR